MDWINQSNFLRKLFHYAYALKIDTWIEIGTTPKIEKKSFMCYIPIFHIQHTQEKRK